jgi:hypothetical protein
MFLNKLKLTLLNFWFYSKTETLKITYNLWDIPSNNIVIGRKGNRVKKCGLTFKRLEYLHINYRIVTRG